MTARTRSAMKVMVTNDRLSIILSCLALTVSAASAYYTSLTQRVDVTASITGGDHRITYIAGTALGGSYSPHLTLINSGNTPLAVVRATLHFYQVTSSVDERTGCVFASRVAVHGASMKPVEGAFSPTVIRPNDIQIIPLQFSGAFHSSRTTTVFSRSRDSKPFSPLSGDERGLVRIKTCLEISFIPTHGRLEHLEWNLGFDKGYADDLKGLAVRRSTPEEEQTVELIRETRWIFW